MTLWMICCISLPLTVSFLFFFCLSILVLLQLRFKVSRANGMHGLVGNFASEAGSFLGELAGGALHISEALVDVVLVLLQEVSQDVVPDPESTVGGGVHAPKEEESLAWVVERHPRREKRMKKKKKNANHRKRRSVKTSIKEKAPYTTQ